jgi:hypothetical protein
MLGIAVLSGWSKNYSSINYRRTREMGESSLGIDRGSVVIIGGGITMDNPESSSGMNDAEDVKAQEMIRREDVGLSKSSIRLLCRWHLAPLPHDSSHGSADNEVSKKMKESRAMKKAIHEKKERKKDPNAPKKAMTAFVFFAVSQSES